MPCCSSLKKEELLSVMVPGSAPVIDPDDELGPKVPSVVKSKIEALFDCVPPPAIKSNVSVEPVPSRLEVLMLTS
jgi:hypothetical protein